MVLNEGTPAGSLVPYVTAEPTLGNRAIWYDNKEQIMYHVLWTAERLNTDTGLQEGAGWKKYSVCHLWDREHPDHGNVQTLKDAPLTTVLEGMLKLQVQERTERVERERRDRERQETLELRDYSARYSTRGDPLGERDAFTPAGMAATQSKDLMKHFLPWGDQEKQGVFGFDLWYDRILAAVENIGGNEYHGIAMHNLKLTLLNAIKHPMARKIEDLSLADPAIKALKIPEFLALIRKRFKPDVDSFNSETEFRAFKQATGQNPVMYFQRKLLLYKAAYSSWKSEGIRKFLNPLCDGFINNDIAIKLQEKVLFAIPEIGSLDKLRDLLEIIVSVQKQNVTSGRVTGDAGKGLHSESSDTEGRAAGKAGAGAGRKQFRVQEVEWEDEEDGPTDVSECAFVSELSGFQILYLQNDLSQEFELHAIASKWGTPKTCFGCGSESHFLRDCKDTAAVQRYKTERKKNAPPKGTKPRGGGRGRGGARGRGGITSRGGSIFPRGAPPTTGLLPSVQEIGVDESGEPDEHFYQDQ